MKLNKMKIKLGEKVVKSPRLLKEEKLELLACIKEEKDPEILECLLHEYDVPKEIEKTIVQMKQPTADNANRSFMPAKTGLGYSMIHFIAKRRYKTCMKNASKIKDPSERKKHTDSCMTSLQTIKDYV